jgi:hypothetical protein
MRLHAVISHSLAVCQITCLDVCTVVAQPHPAFPLQMAYDTCVACKMSK